MAMKSFREALGKRVLVCDGAMGTLLYRKGEMANRSFEQVNLTKPELVRDVHREYIAAGADILETNSFAANRYRLAGHGLEGKVREINIAAAQNAVYEARGGVYVAGSVGPLGTAVSPEDAEEAFREQASALLEGGVDIFFLETFPGTAEITSAIKAIRGIDEEVPIIAHLTFDENSMTPRGEKAEDIARFLDEQPVDAIGVNCSVGPAPMLETVKILVEKGSKPVSVMPNAGNAHIIDGRHMYMTTPEYFVTYAKRFIRTGAKIVGGCCGTLPNHIKLVSNAVKALSDSRVSIETVPAIEIETVPTREKSEFARKLSEGKFVTCVEILPPKGTDYSKALKKAERLKQAGVDAVNIPDGPRATARMSPLSLAMLFRDEADMEPIIHYTCRDRNLLGMQSDLLGADALGIKNVLAVTGDPPKLGNYPDATAVYDVDAIGLVKMINNLNHGLDLAGDPIGQPTSIHIGVGVNPVAINLEQEITRFRQKVANGAEFVFTQPIFDNRKFLRFKELTYDINIPILIGILPLTSLKMAEFLNSEVPGMNVPPEIRKRMEAAGENARDEGIRIAGESLAATKDYVQGAYVMSPGGGIKPALKVLEGYL